MIMGQMGQMGIYGPGETTVVSVLQSGFTEAAELGSRKRFKFDTPTGIGKTGVYRVVLPDQWVGSDTIGNVTARAGGLASLPSVAAEGNIVEFSILGTQPAFVPVELGFTAGGRSMCITGYVKVAGC